MKLIKLFLYVCITLTFIQDGQSQVPGPKFKEAKPLWSYLISDKNFTDTTSQFNKYSSISVIYPHVQEQSLYFYNSCLNIKQDPFGGMLTKLDINTGDLIWDQYFNNYSGEKFQEFFYKPIYTEDNKIELIGKQKIDPPNNDFPLWAFLASRPVKRIYDSDTGQLLEHIYSASDTTGIFSGPGGGAFISSDERDVHVYCQPQIRTSYWQNLDSSDYYYNFYHLGDSLLISENQFDSIPYIPTGRVDDFPFQFLSPIESLNDSIILGWVWHHNLSDDLFRSQLIWMKVNTDYTIEVVRRKNIEQYINHYNVFPSRIILQENEDLILSEIYLLNGAKTHRWLLWLDKEGNVKTHTLDLAYLGNAYTNLKVLKSTESKLYLLGGPSFKDPKGVDILSINTSGAIEYLGSITPTEDEDFQVYADRQLVTSDNKLILIGSRTNKKNYVVAFDLKDLGIEITSSTDDITNKDYEVFPNPAYESIKITRNKNNTTDESIVLYDINGLQISKSSFLDKQEIQIDVSFLPKGIYLLHITDGHGKLISPVKKIVKI